MFTGSPTNDDQPRIPDTGRVETDEEPNDDGATDDDPSLFSRVVSAARTASEIAAPFAAIFSSLVHAITVYKFINKV